MNNKLLNNERDINKIKDYYNDNWSKEKEKKSDRGWGYEQKRLHNTIFEFIGNNEKKLILEIGCGKGDLTTKLSKKFKNIIALDISSSGVHKAKKRIDSNCNCEFLLCDATKLPFNDNQFDLVIFSEVLEHLLDQNKSIKEIHRVLKPDSALILTTPNSGGFHRIFLKIASVILNKPQKYSDQIIDNPLSASELEQMLLPEFSLLQRRGLVYTVPHLQVLKSKTIINFSNRISEFIEIHNFFPYWGLYHCILCYPKKCMNERLCRNAELTDVNQ